MVLEYFLTAFALMLVLEGIMPFLSPARWREVISNIVRQDDRVIRMLGFISMLIGVIILFIVHRVIQV